MAKSVFESLQGPLDRDGVGHRSMTQRLAANGCWAHCRRAERRAFDEVATLMRAATDAELRARRASSTSITWCYPGQRSAWERTLRPCFQSGTDSMFDAARQRLTV